ncbi:MAG: glycoside hydrolase family 31 protein [Woeseiaceae bacterium]|nr:glycoside hydrolase family 31 protein [Woeseiaceae bacterium]
MRARQFFAATLAAATLWAAAPASADFGEYEGHAQSGQTLEISTSAGTLGITAINEATFYVHYVEPGVRQLPPFALSGDTDDVDMVVSETADSLSFGIPGLTAMIEKSPVSIRYLRDGEVLVDEEHGYFAYDTVRGFRFALDDAEKILGGGQRVLGMDRRGRRMPLYNRASYGYEDGDTEQMYYSLPAILSSDRYIIAFDNTASGWLDIGSTEAGVLQFEAVGGRTAYLVSAGTTYPELIRHFTAATGRQPLPPRWAFGNYASRFGYRTEKETRDVVRRFRRADIPLDGVILDLYWFGPEIQGFMGNLDWDREAFPNPEKMIADFLDDGVRTVPITEPFVLTASDNWDDAVASGAIAKNATGEPKTFNFYFGNTGLIDVFNAAGRNWFWSKYEALFDIGVGGTWGDLGEPEVHPGDALHSFDDGTVATGDEVHNAYGHRWAQLVYENQVERYPDTRPVILMRSGFVGSQRFGMMPWTGDVARSWGGLRPQVELSLQMGLLGLAYNHSDLGGFAGGETFDKEMYLRWMQYGVFQPIYRPHAQEHIAPEPVFHDRETRRIARDFIRLRYALLPYIYTLAWENSTTGMPLMRPLFFEDESDLALVDEKYAYLWGNAFLVRPVTEAGLDAIDMPLPDGTWFDFWTDTRYEGGQTASVPFALETTPVLVRAGSFVPMVEPVNTTDAYSTESLTVHYYADASVRSAGGRMYDDDGRSRTSLDDGEFEILFFEALQNGATLNIDLARAVGGYDGMPATRTITLVVHNWASAPGAVSFENSTIDLERRMPKRGTAAHYDSDARTLTIRFDWDHSVGTLRISE